MRAYVVKVRKLRVDRLALLLVVAAAGATLVATALAAGFRLIRPGALPGTVVHGVEVGGLAGDDLERSLGTLAERYSGTRVRVERAPAAGEGRGVVSAPRRAMGYSLDVEATAARVLARGRGWNPFTALWDHARAFAWTTTVQAVEPVDGKALARWAKKTAEDLSVPPAEGDLEIDGTTVEAVYPEPGAVVDADDLRRAGRAALRSGSVRIEADAAPARPRTNDDDVDAVAAVAEQTLSGPISLTREDASLDFSPEEIGALLDVRVTEEDGDPTLELFVRPKRLENRIGDRAGALESSPRDATFRLSGGRVEVVASSPGFAFNSKKAARQVVAVATSDDGRRAELRGDRIAPEFSTKDATALEIREQVSSFTTYHSCCEARVQNIHRIADIVSGTIVAPGESFSLNGHVGPRTQENGFVGAPSIRDGEFVEEIGGGISQFATTIFNAIYFGGYDLLAYQAHSYYIDRYPMGREATISTPAPDLAFRNDSDAGVFIATSYTDTSITVSFYGTQPITVESETGPRTNVREPPEECTVNKDLKRREERVVSSGREGFDVVVKRILVHPGGRREVEDFFTRYQPEPKVVERRRCRSRD